MCGRYTLTRDNHLEMMLEEAGFLFEEFNDIRMLWGGVRYNIAPSQRVPILSNEQPPKPGTASWGLLPIWAKDRKAGYSMINARCETVATKPAFKSAFRKRRCLMPADGFYEWRTDGKLKTPFRFTLKDEEPFAFAGLWEDWSDPAQKDSPSREVLRTCALITTTPNTVVQPVHDRMPVILPRDRMKRWLDPETPEDELRAMLVPYPAELMRAYEVSREVNKATSNGQQLIEPVPAALTITKKELPPGETGELF